MDGKQASCHPPSDFSPSDAKDKRQRQSLEKAVQSRLCVCTPQTQSRSCTHTPARLTSSRSLPHPLRHAFVARALVATKKVSICDIAVTRSNKGQARCAKTSYPILALHCTNGKSSQPQPQLKDLEELLDSSARARACTTRRLCAANRSRMLS